MTERSLVSSAKAPSGRKCEQVVVRQLRSRAAACVAGEQIRTNIIPLGQQLQDGRSAARPFLRECGGEQFFIAAGPFVEWCHLIDVDTQ